MSWSIAVPPTNKPDFEQAMANAVLAAKLPLPAIDHAKIAGLAAMRMGFVMTMDNDAAGLSCKLSGDDTSITVVVAAH